MKANIFTPNQISFASLVPAAAVYVLWKNFGKLGRPDRASRVFFWGSIITVGVLASVPFFPDWFPPILIPIVSTVTARVIAEKFQIKKQFVQESIRFQAHTTWHVIGMSVAFLVTTGFLLIMWMYLLGELGLLTITD